MAITQRSKDAVEWRREGKRKREGEGEKEGEKKDERDDSDSGISNPRSTYFCVLPSFSLSLSLSPSFS